MVVSIILIVLFVGLGFLFSKGKGEFLLAGYNTMSAAEKEKYDMVAICKFMGKMMYALSFSMLFWALSDVVRMTWLLYFGLTLFLGIIIFMIIYTNTGNRFKSKKTHK